MPWGIDDRDQADPRTWSADRPVTYYNTPEQARQVGWDRLPEYCFTREGHTPLPTAAQQRQYAKVTHDHHRGYFLFHN